MGLLRTSPDVIISMDASEIRRYIKNLRGENRTLKLEIKEYQKENARLHEIIKTLETQAVENLREQGIIK
jgi:Pyruvate/2-oxoacid:ferredoxin oxidoreductase gamma subunit